MKGFSFHLFLHSFVLGKSRGDKASRCNEEEGAGVKKKQLVLVAYLILFLVLLLLFSSAMRVDI